MNGKRTLNAARLQELMDQAGLTQLELAKRIRVKSSNVSRWLSNETMPRPRKIKAMAAIFKIKVDELLSEPVQEKV